MNGRLSNSAKGYGKSRPAVLIRPLPFVSDIPSFSGRYTRL